VPEKLLYSQQVNAAHHQVTRERVSQVVESEILDPSFLDGPLKCRPQAADAMPVIFAENPLVFPRQRPNHIDELTSLGGFTFFLSRMKMILFSKSRSEVVEKVYRAPWTSSSTG